MEITTSIGTMTDSEIATITKVFAMVRAVLGFSIQAGRADWPKAKPQSR